MELVGLDCLVREAVEIEVNIDAEDEDARVGGREMSGDAAGFEGFVDVNTGDEGGLWWLLES